jgi:hypothetical protein
LKKFGVQSFVSQKRNLPGDILQYNTVKIREEDTLKFFAQNGRINAFYPVLLVNNFLNSDWVIFVSKWDVFPAMRCNHSSRKRIEKSNVVAASVLLYILMVSGLTLLQSSISKTGKFSKSFVIGLRLMMGTHPSKIASHVRWQSIPIPSGLTTYMNSDWRCQVLARDIDPLSNKQTDRSICE